ncbi:preprotein translocase subunit SecY [Marinitenerispora sediminis]|uniref:Protein translocase subunit SecY n=1 Tax=Marinitenerispora sediminis TaxID=1931232 RepID=A0A368TBH6_9ACTN|nr:preprotein translocase subunit SecY [Marinitenerispora sediminis]RCV55542.1 preprotein translocase subunit SecY [Marinitenerispora sediminis]RCV61870.1 preprotein translocase subunit SecY [Marinitenerispora sediminis]RCV62246.1 preprotein translocase subunit SecY [Marinitenerispora sediminis]
MLGAFVRAFRTPDLRNKLLFTLFILTIYRLGSVIPAPGINPDAIRQCLQGAQTEDTTGLYSLVNLFSGGALLQLAIFALGIMPYITASIILNLLTVVIPRLEALKKEGQAGQAKITQYTRYLTVALALLQSTSIIAMARTGQLFQGACPPSSYMPSEDLLTLITIVFVMTAGTCVIMWFGELITERGVGNGMSLLIFTTVVAVFPSSMARIWSEQSPWIFAIICVAGLVLIAGVVFMEQAQRRIPVQYAKRMVGRRMYGGSSTYIPLKVNQAGVIPVIFASSLLYLPQLAIGLLGQDSDNPVVDFLSTYFGPTGTHPVYMASFFALIVGFAFFYVAITFNPAEVADNMKKYGGFIPGIRPGRPTAEYLDFVLTRLTTPGALYLGLIALLPMLALGASGASGNFPFGGTSILIMVGVGLDTVKQIESHLQQRNYEGFLR